jgi:hypothetical protein
MKATEDLLTDPRIQAAVAELQKLIRARFPEATFSVGLGDDPPGVYLRAVVDVDDRWEFIDLVSDRLADMQFDEELPIYLVPSRTPERNAAIWRAILESRRSSEAALASSQAPTT